MRPSLSVLERRVEGDVDCVIGALGEKVNDGTGVPFGGRMMPGGTRRMLNRARMAFA